MRFLVYQERGERASFSSNDIIGALSLLSGLGLEQVLKRREPKDCVSSINKRWNRALTGENFNYMGFFLIGVNN